MIQHQYETKVYYFDTDAYNIVWHGNYPKWFEVGRVEYFALVGIDFNYLNENNILLPMVNLSVRYRYPSKFADTLLITTELEELSKLTIKFKHTALNKNQDKISATGFTEVTVTDFNGKLYRRMPDYILEKFNKLL